MDIENELRGIRYLLNDLILYVYDLRIKLDEIAPSKRPYTMGEPNANGNSVAFDLFAIPKKSYKELIDHFGEDIVITACVKLDSFIKLNDYVPYRTPAMALKRKFIKEALSECKSNTERNGSILPINEGEEEK